MDASSKKLSILIPTYNRLSCVSFLLSRLTLQVNELGLASDIEIIVSDNCSSDRTIEEMERWKARVPYLRAVQTPEHWASAEENLFFGYKQCRGEFIWPFGDDDIPVHDALANVMTLIESTQYDFHLVNPAQISITGEIIVPYSIKMQGSERLFSMRELAQCVGFITILASFTSTIIRRSAIADVDFDHYLKLSPIYAHVASYFECFASKPVKFINQPWVLLREGTTLKEFKALARKRSNPTYYPWTVGLMRLQNDLIRRGFLEPDDLFHTLETDKLGRYRTYVNIFFMFCQQLELWLNDLREFESSTEALSREEFDEFRLGLSGGPQWVLETFLKLEHVFHLIGVVSPPKNSPQNAADVTEDGLHHLKAAMPPFLWKQVRESYIAFALKLLHESMWFAEKCRVMPQDEPDMITTCDGYNIHRLGGDYIAIPEHLRLPDSDLVNLNRHDLGPPDSRLLVGTSVANVKQRIAKQLADEIKVGNKPETLGDFTVIRRDNKFLAVHQKALIGNPVIDLNTIPLVQLPPLILVGDFLESIVPLINQYSTVIPPISDPQEQLKQTVHWVLAREWYASAYSEVKVALESGDAADAEEFFLSRGLAMNQRPTPLIDIRWYLSHHSEAEEAVRTGRVASVMHYLLSFALFEGADFCPIFDETWYCRTYSEAAQAVLGGQVRSGFEYYLRFGCQQAHDPCPDFNERFYQETYPNAAKECASGFYRSGAEHFLDRGIALGYAPNAIFDETHYLNSNADVKSAVEAGTYSCGLMHWLAHGKQERRVIAPGEYISSRVHKAGERRKTVLAK